MIRSFADLKKEEQKKDKDVEYYAGGETRCAVASVWTAMFPYLA